ncbi:hypothetical protein ACSDR0_34045 [Streptosporangium sp. G11]|uniref:hypothetical protein n=1 Tax=Streptosporangium sp. G11 TaxID=3436926 RepID=UPI003EBF0AB9
MALPYVSDGYLTKVKGSAPSNVWAVGGIGWVHDPGGFPNGWILDPGGFPSPPRLACGDSYENVRLRESGDIWPLVMYWDAGEWRRLELPGWRGTLVDLAVSAPDDVWVAGLAQGKREEVTLFHYNGYRWARETVHTGQLYTLALVPGTRELWLAGTSMRKDRPPVPVVFRRGSPR